MATGDLLCVSLHDKVGFSAIFHALHGTIIFKVDVKSITSCFRDLIDLEGRFVYSEDLFLFGGVVYFFEDVAWLPTWSQYLHFKTYVARLLPS